MAYTYLITGATSDVGRALMVRLLRGAPGALILAQGCGDLDKLAPLCQQYPGQIRPFDVDLSDRAKVDTFMQLLGASAPRAHPFHPSAGTARRQHQIQSLRPDPLRQGSGDRGAQRHPHLPRRAARHGPRQVRPRTVHPDQLHHRLPAQKHRRLRDGQERHRRAGQEPGRGICQVRRDGELRGPPA